MSRLRRPLVDAVCEYCKEKFQHKKRPDNPRRFCSNACRGKACYGKKHYGWKGGAVIEGYRRVSMFQFEPQHHTILRPMLKRSKHQNYVAEHRAIMALHLGRSLTKRETVHHLNGDKLDNRISNLELRVGPHGPGATASALVCPHCHKAYA